LIRLKRKIVVVEKGETREQNGLGVSGPEVPCPAEDEHEDPEQAPSVGCSKDDFTGTTER
jgi:hypothetical protein